MLCGCMIVSFVVGLAVVVVFLFFRGASSSGYAPVLEPSFLAIFKESVFRDNSSLHAFTVLSRCFNGTHVLVEIPLREVVTTNIGFDRVSPWSDEYENLTIQKSIDAIIHDYRSLYNMEEMILRPEFIDIVVHGRYIDADMYAKDCKTFAKVVSKYGCQWKKRNFHVDTKRKVNKVILFGIDGLGTHNMEAAKTPTLDDIRKHGKVSLRAWLDTFSQGTGSGPNWSGILTGRNSDITGVKGNDCIQPRVKTIMQKVIEHGKKSAVLAEWERFQCFFNDSSYHMPYKWTGTSGSDDFDKPDAIPYTYMDLSLIMQKVHSDYDFIFIYAGSLDYIGHRGSEERYTKNWNSSTIII